ncbi:MAG: hypothetical protein AUG51_05555 [Acidobacteria bacterium 13_1_20CM_3_53_8]|nr:MAG: hypothetical protein AUG51_05555 [Acidobacteria bacterium 13_1_20CM_3_53_8]
MRKLIIAILAVMIVAASAAAQNAPTLRIVESNGPGLPADLYYGDIKVKPVRVRPGTNQRITIDDADFFVMEHYFDFLNRYPDAGGLSYWTSQITQCGTNASCVDQARITVSAAFFIELEFKNTGYYVYRFYKGALARKPTYEEFMPDRRLVVGGANEEAGRASYAETFTQRPEFTQKYPATMTPTQFVNALLATVKQISNVDLSSQASFYVGELNSGQTRGQVVRQVIETPAFDQSQNNEAFVRMQYFGYLRRNPDEGGEAFWLNILNNKLPNDATGYRAMVAAFILSKEYRERF